LDQAVFLFEQSLTLFRELAYQTMILHALYFLYEVSVQRNETEKALALAEEGLAESRRTHNLLGEELGLRNLGRLAYARANYATATALYTESLALCIAGDLWLEVGHRLPMLAASAAAQGLCEQALVLWGAFQSFLGTGVWSAPASHLPGGSELESLLPAVRAQLGEAAFDALIARGQAMSVEQAAAYALATAQPGASMSIDSQKPVGTS
jgi:hypothetical protein